MCVDKVYGTATIESPRMSAALKASMQLSVISEFRLAIDNYGVDYVMSHMDDETFWKLWSWFREAIKQRHL